MKGLKRLMAALLAVAIMISAAPVMQTEAATSIKGSFVAWAGNDCSQAYIGIDSQYNVTEFWYKVYDMADLTTPVKTAHQDGYYQVNNKKCVKITGRKSLVTAVRIKAKINNPWTAWTGYIGIIPLHTSEYCQMEFLPSSKGWKITWSKFRGLQDYEVWVSTTGTGGWKMLTRTTGTSYTFTKLNGAGLIKNQNYYIKVIGRAKIGSTVAKAKGDSNSWYIWKVWYY